MVDSDVNRELKRKQIHYVGLSVPLLYYFVFDRLEMLLFVGISLVAFLIIDYCRLYRNIAVINRFFQEERYTASIRLPVHDGGKMANREIHIPTFGEIMRSEEKRGLGAQTYFAAGSLVCILLYSKNIAVASVAALVIGDSVAAIVGKAIGRHRIDRKKTLEGYLACLVASLGICVILLPASVAVPGAIGAATTELFSRFNDNFSIPVLTGAVMTVAHYLT
jgi:dolichol kinase